MGKIFTAFRRWLDTWPTSPGLIRSGKWRVYYYEGGCTHGMTWDVATDYAIIFGGEVRHIEEPEPEWWSGHITRR